MLLVYYLINYYNKELLCILINVSTGTYAEFIGSSKLKIFEITDFYNEI